jgi:hypothetical protein
MTSAGSTQQFEEQLARRSRVVAFWSAVGALLTLSALVFSSIHLASVRGKTQEVETRLKAEQAELEQVETRLEQVKAQLKRTVDVYGLTLNLVSKSPEGTTAAFKQAVSQVQGAAGITIQIAYKNQLDKAKDIASQLRTLGYEVPPDQTIEIRGAHISEGTYLRYFFQSDEALANQIVNQIKGMGVDVQPYSLIGAKDLGEVHPRNFEFRLGQKYNQQETKSPKETKE